MTLPETEQNQLPWESVELCVSHGPVIFRGARMDIKRLSIQQVQQEGPVTLGALPLSITHSALLGMRVEA